MPARLTKVTITGADDGAPAEDLLGLSEEFPFVEWGVLVSATAQGARFPSWAWMNELNFVAQKHKLNVAMHVCGRWVREIYRCEMHWVDLPPVFACAQRVQLNTHGAPHERAMGWWDALPKHTGFSVEREWIVQLDDVNNCALEVAAHCGVKCSGLFDLSHGAGVLPAQWPPALTWRPCGYAGGLGPDNVHDQVKRILAVAHGDFWIDMETRVRTPDDIRLDLGRVRRVLEATREFCS